ncbi:putative ribonuclease H-like domain-containing protein [Tanacetum coccineum]
MNNNCPSSNTNRTEIGVVERRNRTLVEAARTMLSASKLPLSFWAEAVATACYTQNRSIIISNHGKMAYHIINDKKPFNKTSINSLVNEQRAYNDVEKLSEEEQLADSTVQGICPKHVSHQSPREKVGSNDMVHNYYLEKAKKSAQLQKDKDVNGKPSMIDPARLPNTANGCKPKPRNWQASMSSRVSNKDVHLGEHRKQKPFLKLNLRASAQDKDAKSHKTTKRYMPVEKSSASKKPERQIPTGHRFSNKRTTTVPEKTMNPRSCLSWKPMGRIFKTIGL